GPRSPGRLITSKAPKGRPICGSDRVSETLHSPNQREEHAARIITADLRALRSTVARRYVLTFGTRAGRGLKASVSEGNLQSAARGAADSHGAAVSLTLAAQAVLREEVGGLSLAPVPPVEVLHLLLELLMGTATPLEALAPYLPGLFPDLLR